MAKATNILEDPVLEKPYEFLSDSGLRKWPKEKIIAQLRRAEEGMRTAIDLSHDVLELVKGWTPVAVRCYRCRHEELRWMPDGKSVAFCKNEWGLKGPLRGSDFCPYGEERKKDG